MIAKEKDQCSGCGACLNICPKSCITFQEDQEGFLYPLIDKGKCIKCNRCVNVCSYINPLYINSKLPLTIYAAFSKNEETRKRSSSGGLFTEVAEYIINSNGYVFGAQFDEEWNVIHTGSNDIKELHKYRGSKYVQSNTLFTYREVKDKLSKNFKVLYTGTPCQILGLKKYLGKEYENLFTMDLVCHGVPSPKIWQLFKNKLVGGGKEYINSIEFRNKDKGWRNYSLRISTDTSHYIYSIEDNQSSYMKGFLKELYLRPSCYNCIAKSFKSGSDLTIADYWWIHGIRPQLDDNKGCSLVYINTCKGLELFEQLDIIKEETFSDSDIQNAYLYKGAVTHSVKPHVKRDSFFNQVNGDNVILLIDRYTQPTFKELVTNILKKQLRKAPILMMFYKKYIKKYIGK